MKITNINQYLNFGKTLQAQCKILNSDNIPTKASIYKLDSEEDVQYFNELESQQDWWKSEYINFLKGEIKYVLKHPTHDSIYVMEDEDNRCLGVLELSEAGSEDEVMILETAPKFQADGSDNRKYKYIGETLLSFAAIKAKNDYSEQLNLFSSESAVPFYERKCGFIRKDDESPEFYLPNESFDKLIQQNEAHTKSKIDFVV